MCGICGMVGESDEGVLARMLESLRHRGPDEEGRYADSTAALGCRRLRVIDPDGSHQPISDETGGLRLVCNGEIYNYRELRSELLARGHRFATNGDAEPILHLYQEMGERCVERLNGMFAFAILDVRARKLFLARDRIGIKPLLYAERGGRLLFASELKALLAHPATPREIDRESLDLYLTFRYVPAPRTIIKGVRKLPPGHTLSWENGRTTIRKYWDLPDPQDSETPSLTALEELDGLLSDSVRMELGSDVPLGAYLSGGVDSSIVAALMARANARQVSTFSMGFAERGFDERDEARRVAAFLGTNHHEFLSLPEPSLRDLPRIVWHLDEPVADAAAIPTWQMAQATKERATVVLTGEGADELFAGYPYYKFFVWTNRLRAALWPMRLAGGRTGEYFASIKDRAQAYLALKSVFTAPERKSLLLDAETERASDIVREHVGRDGSSDHLQQLQRLDVKYWLPDDLLVKVDRMTMAHAVEARVPYLDHRLVEFMFRLPSELKLRGTTDKYLLRRLGARLLPARTARRRKRGFAVPTAQWLRGDRLASELLSDESVRKRGLFRAEVVRGLTERHNPGMFERRQLWTLLCLELWCRVFLDRDPIHAPDAGETSR